MRPVQEIEVEKTDRGIRMTHPAFGQLGAFRTSGRRTLYGSDFEHNAYITIRLSASELNRDLSRDWPYAKKQLFEISLSEAQWATFVSALNVGEGVQCTIDYREGHGYVPSFPIPDRTAQYSAEFAGKLDIALHKLRTLINTIEDMPLPKAKKDTLKGPVNSVITELKHNLPYVARSFDEHVEETVEKMKSEVHGYIQGVLTRTGLEALQGQSPVLLEESKE
ncbi:hypothetical protein [Hyphomicrobium sp. ghe19]|uniref:hypothetical protein n=1 Tax=Hyphomicrobium sp. ghe19 TaxID=2682968 RepID=UPI001366E79D|nr:hypothetical protein HYPP_02425 [Hyphomicrobium sp. ghe19]